MKKEIVFEFNIIMTGQNDYRIKEDQITDNSFSCKINGEDFKPGNSEPGGCAPLYGGYCNDFTIVRITAKCTITKPYKYIIIELNNFKGAGEYLLSDTANDCRYEEFYPDNTYKSTLTKKGKVIIIKDDRVNFILAGSFEFVGANTTDNKNIITVSNGHFNIKF
ncbi:MAG TPA: hypothetical protein VMY77_08665 [Chitinophagaceae bacterium]|nr:hypothetical protein [Chitinophagaceae bacterium]